MNIRLRQVDLSVGSFYAKYCSGEEMFKELLGKKIADMLGIKCPNYYMFKDERCILSEDLKEYNNFKSAYELMKNGTTINDLRTALEYQSGEYNRYTNVDELMFQIYTMHFMDILFSNTDRHLDNYGFVLNEDGTGALVVFDHGMLLDHLHIATQPLSFPTADALDYARYSKEAECRYFMEHADDEIMRMIQSILSRFDLSVF